MMKRVASVIAAAMLAVSCGGGETPATTETAPAEPQPQAAPAALTPTWEVTEGIETPESVYFDAGSNHLYSSQIAGAPDGRDGNGRIVKLTPDGQVVSATWVTGLNAPKGLRSHDGTLWVADLGEVIAIDVDSGKITSRVALEGAMFPNDVATGPDGTVYVSDMGANRIYAIQDGTASVFAEGDQLEHPNGLLVDGDRLIVGGWGSAPKPDFSTDVPGRLFALDLETKEKTLITQEPFANIDGVERDGQGGYLVTDYLKGQVIRVTSDGGIEPIAQFMAGTADIGINGNTLLVPHMNENKVAAYTLP